MSMNQNVTAIVEAAFKPKQDAGSPNWEHQVSNGNTVKRRGILTPFLG